MVGKRVECDEEAVRGAYNDGSSFSEVADQFGISRFVVRRIIRKAGITVRTRSDYCVVAAERVERARVAYASGVTLEVAAESVGVSFGRLAVEFDKLGIKRRTAGRVKIRLIAEQSALVEQLYDEGLGVGTIAKRLGMGTTPVARYLREVGIDPARRGSAKRLPGVTRRHATPKGYIRVALVRDHPMVGMIARDGYVMEHRLVMAMALGRVLSCTETVHHIDGNPSHNALSNLQLRIGSHGPGIVVRCVDCGSRRVAPVPISDPPVLG